MSLKVLIVLSVIAAAACSPTLPIRIGLGGHLGGGGSVGGGGNTGVGIGIGGSGGGVIGGVIKTVFGAINGVAKTAIGALNAVIGLVIGTLNDVFRLICNLTLVLQATLNGLLYGLGTLFARLVAVVLKIAICVLGLPGGRGICAKGWNAQWGIKAEVGANADAWAYIKLFELTNAQAQLDAYIKTLSGGKGIASTSGSIKIVLTQISTLCGYITNYKQISKDTVTETFVIMTTVSASISNSRKRNSGLEIVNKIVPDCSIYFKKNGYADISAQVTIIESVCDSANGDNVNWNGNGNANNGSNGNNNNNGNTNSGSNGNSNNNDNNGNSSNDNNNNGNTNNDSNNGNTNNNDENTNNDNTGNTNNDNTGNTNNDNTGNTNNDNTGNTNNDNKGNTNNDNKGNTNNDNNGNTNNDNSNNNGNDNNDNNGNNNNDNTGTTNNDNKGNTNNDNNNKNGNSNNDNNGNTSNDNNENTNNDNNGNNNNNNKGNTNNDNNNNKGNTNNDNNNNNGNTNNDNNGNTNNDNNGNTNNDNNGNTNNENNGNTNNENNGNTNNDNNGNTNSDNNGNTNNDNNGNTNNDNNGNTNNDNNGNTNNGNDNNNNGNNNGSNNNNGGNSDNGNDCGKVIGGVLQIIPGVTRISTDIIAQLVRIKVNAIIDVVNLVAKTAIAVGGIVESIISGLGGIFVRIVAVILKIGVCVNGWGGDKSICNKEWNAQFGIIGDASAAVDIIGLFRLNNCETDVTTAISTYTKSKGSATGLVKIIIQLVTELSDIVSSGSISKSAFSTVSINVITLFGACGDSYKAGSGSAVVRKVLPVISVYFVKQGFASIVASLKTIIANINFGAKVKFDWSIVKNAGTSKVDELTSKVKQVFGDAKNKNNVNQASLTAVLNLEAPKSFEAVLSFGINVVRALASILDISIKGLGTLIVRLVGGLINYIVAILGAARNAKSFVAQNAYYESFGVTVSGKSWAAVSSGFQINNCKADLDGILAAYTKNEGLKSLKGAQLVIFNSAYGLVDIALKGTAIVEADLTAVFRIVTTLLGGFANSLSANVGKTICDNMLPTTSYYLEQNGYPSFQNTDTIYTTIASCNNVAVPWSGSASTTVVSN